jgi:hypothetical protein
MSVKPSCTAWTRPASTRVRWARDFPVTSLLSGGTTANWFNRSSSTWCVVPPHRPPFGIEDQIEFRKDAIKAICPRDWRNRIIFTPEYKCRRAYLLSLIFLPLIDINT